MKKFIFLIFIIITYNLSNTALAEENPQTSEIFPSLIKVIYENGEILIEFEPVKDENIKYNIYRSKTSPIIKTNIIDAKLLKEITKNKIPFKDIPENDGKYYYAATAVKDGKEYLNLVPFQNTIVNPIDFSPFPKTVEEIDIKIIKDTDIEIKYSPVIKTYTYKLYSSSDKITDINGLHALKIQNGNKDSFNVTIEKNTPYYFLITNVNRLGIENNSIILGKNENIKPFMIKKLEEIKKKEVKRKIIITNKNLITMNLKNNFYKNNYEKALNEFFSILKRKTLNTSEKETVYFYMGQCYFYLGDYRKAIKYFILSKITFKGQSEAWIDRCLERID